MSINCGIPKIRVTTILCVSNRRNGILQMQTLIAQGYRNAPDQVPSALKIPADAKQYSAPKKWLFGTRYFGSRCNHPAGNTMLSNRIAIAPLLFGSNHTKPAERMPTGAIPGDVISFLKNARLS